MKSLYVGQIKELELSLQKLKAAYEGLKKKKNSEISVYKGEIKSLRQQFKGLKRDIELKNNNAETLKVKLKIVFFFKFFVGKLQKGSEHS